MHSAQAALPAALVSILIALLLFGPVYWLGGVGGGDFKLSLALACIIASFEPTIRVMLFTTIAGAFLALANAYRHGQLADVWRRLKSREARKSSPPLTIPYAPAFLLGTVAELVLTVLPSWLSSRST